MGGSRYKNEYERIPKRFLVGNVIIQNQWENQE